MRIVKGSFVFAVLACVGVLSTAASAKEADEKAVEYRQAVLRVIGVNLRPMVFMARGMSDYDAEEVALRATRINQLSQMVEEAFTRDTSGVDGLSTEALDKIWSNWDDFGTKVSALQEASLALSDAPADLAGFKAAFSKLGQACKGCHDNYKAE
ncbi:MAG: cytochrome c [Pseudomonadota bacterium]